MGYEMAETFLYMDMSSHHIFYDVKLEHGTTHLFVPTQLPTDIISAWIWPFAMHKAFYGRHRKPNTAKAPALDTQVILYTLITPILPNASQEPIFRRGLRRRVR